MSTTSFDEIIGETTPRVSIKKTAVHSPASLAGAIDARDLNTPDDWVPRHKDMIRLTGRHPFNSEPQVDDLMKSAKALSGLTPSALHYVRNHGAVPKLAWHMHKVAVEGVRYSKSFSMDELLAMEAVEFNLTLTCAGNRRHEQNMHKNSQGFSWGPSAISTATWTGVPLAALIKHCGGVSEPSKAKFVNFAGCDELPKGFYGTTIPISQALDETSDVILAYKMNGELLPPDHGFPVRIIIPGFIGGRMVKWLSSITISDQESSSQYHFEDNRVLPPNIQTPQDAMQIHKNPSMGVPQTWWQRPEFIINERNINSAIASPAHNSTLTMNPSSAPAKVTIPASGYAYSGGGRRVIRVEVSADDGATWTMARVRYGVPLGDAEVRHEKRWWCWFLWECELDVDVVPGVGAEICVRCWDDAQNTQPRDLTWNLLGMMNNCWYRVKLTPSKTNNLTYVWEHPTHIGESKDAGWMARLKREAASATESQSPSETPVTATATTALPRITMAEVGCHKTEQDCWIVIDGRVLNVTEFLQRHPGGKKSILLLAGQDASEDFHAIHGEAAKKLMMKFVVGLVRKTAKL